MLSFENTVLAEDARNTSSSEQTEVVSQLPLLLATAQKAVRAAGVIQMQRFGKEAPIVLENTNHDLTIETDHASEMAICDVIQHHFPEHAILSEESGFSIGTADYTWIIDPLDGTVNYSFDQTYFCTCAACYHTPLKTCYSDRRSDTFDLYCGHPLVGVVHAPFYDWMCWAVDGNGARYNGLPLMNRQTIGLRDAVVGLSCGGCNEVIDQMGTMAATLARRAKTIRSFGASGLDLVQVAKGTLSGLVQIDVSLWDFAAARLILSESGVCFEARPNRLNGWCIIAAPRSLFPSLKAIVDESLDDGFLV